MKKQMAAIFASLLLSTAILPSFADGDSAQKTQQKTILNNFEEAQTYMFEHNQDLKIKNLELQKTVDTDEETQRSIGNLEDDYDLIMRYGNRDARVQVKVQTEVNKAQSTFNVALTEMMIDVTKEKLTQTLKQLLTQKTETKLTLASMEESQKSLSQQVKQMELQLKLGNIIKTDYDTIVISQKTLENNINRTKDGLRSIERQINLLLSGKSENELLELSFDLESKPSTATYNYDVAKKRLLEEQEYLKAKNKEFEFKQKEYQIYSLNYSEVSYKFMMKKYDFQMDTIRHEQEVEKVMNDFDSKFSELNRLRYDVQIAKQDLDVSKAVEKQQTAKYNSNLITQVALINAQSQVLNKNVAYLQSVSKFNQAVEDFEYFLNYGF